ncbi:MAG: aldehyde dehydrogenase family protein [Xanthomonadales bacterium]|nr:aldehyde dehydrogenase family protein [Xanthomonadales bacterium]NIN58392.1 aldehyde dehydrogenase family protein [Xanthomonadales bacterium]NIN73729.1 aldehyde dehydrogenase family protein [Xanthomonadales bacterium]NIO14527.1 aldehyde dehydrogenase family protein [Xanthomonadales bacterium]NIP10785.1 aldehyde dehydrogenase family protein [Xanthomonadales bacterium]
MYSETGHYIHGEWVRSGPVFDSENPSDLDDPIGRFHAARTEEVEAATEAARQAFHAWSFSALETRQEILDRIGQALCASADELGLLVAREEGKTVAEARGEVFRAGQFFRYYAAEALRPTGELVPSVRPGVQVEVTREPVGVVGIITPWNFPVAVAAWKVAPALAYGNCVILKPSEKTPAAACALAEIIARSDLPDGVFGMLNGDGAGAGQALCSSPGIDAVSFTGSVATGREIARVATERMVKVQLEMGSKNALVVLRDADLDLAVQCAINGAYFGTGQKCTASSRLVVERAVCEPFVEKFTEAARQLRVGHALEPETQIGPVIDRQQLDKNLEYLEIGRAEGATLAFGGECPERPTRGYFMQPALFTGGNNDMRLNREEVFGPIACVLEADDYEHALAIANDTEYGLTAGIITRSLARAAHFKRHAEAGCVMVNLPTAGTDYHVPFGGRKSSSFGPREQGQYAKEFYTVCKTAYVNA